MLSVSYVSADSIIQLNSKYEGSNTFLNNMSITSIQTANRIAQVNFENDDYLGIDLSNYFNSFTNQKFEIVEITDSERIRLTFQQYNSKACKITRDNFGSGYADINNLGGSNYNTIKSIKINGVIQPNSTDNLLIYFRSNTLIEVTLLIHFTSRSIGLYDGSNFLLQSIENVLPVKGTYKYFHFAFFNNPITERFVFSYAAFNDSVYCADSTQTFNYFSIANKLANGFTFRFNFFNINDNCYVYALDSNCFWNVFDSSNNSFELNSNFDLNAIEYFYLTDKNKNIDYNNYFDNIDNDFNEVYNYNMSTLAYNYYSFMNYRTKRLYVTDYINLNLKSIQKYRNNFDLTMYLGWGGLSEFTIIMNNCKLSLKLENNNIILYKDNSLQLNIYNTYYLRAFSVTQILLRVIYYNKQISFDIKIDTNNTIYHFALYLPFSQMQSIIIKSIFPDVSYISNFKIQNALVPVEFENKTTKLTYSNYFIFFNPIFEKELANSFSFINEVKIPYFVAPNLIRRGNKEFNLISVNIDSIAVNIIRNHSSGNYYLTDLSSNYSIFINNTLSHNAQYFNISIQNEGSFYIISKISGPSFITARIDLFYIVYYSITYSDYIAPENLLISQAFDFLLPLTIIGLFTISFYMSNRNKIFAIIGLYLALFVLYFIGMLSLMFLILCIVITTIIMYLIIKNEKENEI